MSVFSEKAILEEVFANGLCLGAWIVRYVAGCTGPGFMERQMFQKQNCTEQSVVMLMCALLLPSFPLLIGSHYACTSAICPVVDYLLPQVAGQLATTMRRLWLAQRMLSGFCPSHGLVMVIIAGEDADGDSSA